MSEGLQPSAAIEPGEVVVTDAGPRYGQSMSDGRHVVTADEPADVGGADAGASPYALLLMALGACTSITLRMYADRSGWPLERVRVRLKHFRGHAGDAALSGEGADSAFLDRIERVIELDGPDLSEVQRERLGKIAESCPVHRTLSHRTLIQTTLTPLR
jgi:putative redox protein